MVLQKSFCLFSLFVCFLFNFLSSAQPDKGPIFATKSVSLGKHKLLVAIADNKVKRLKGLMNRSGWGEWQGMLFIFEEEAPRVFWMKNTQLPLSIGFFDKNKVLLEIQDLEPTRSIFQKKVDRAFSKKAVQYVLEVPRGWFKKHKVRLGAQLTISR